MGNIITWAKVDINAKGNSTIEAENVKQYSNVDWLRQDENDIDNPKYMTVGELNQTILEELQQPIEVKTRISNIVLWSEELSDSMCHFVNPAKFTALFSDVVTSSGITLLFESEFEFCKKVRITWYDIDDEVMDSKIFNPDQYEYFCSNYIEQYKKVYIELLETAYPYRYAKLRGIQYGEKITFDDTQIVRANLIEEVDLTSSKLFTNRVNCDIIILTEGFNIVTNPGNMQGLSLNQRVTVSHTDGTKYGSYYINKSSVSDNIVTIIADDLISYLESQDFKGGLYTNVTFEYILNQIKAQAKLTEVFGAANTGFVVSNEILNKVVTGYIPYTNCREALHQLCYAASVIANTQRTDKIVIKTIDETIKEEIDETKLILGTKTIYENVLYNKIILNAFSYRSSGDEVELERQRYTPGQYTLKFSKPYHDYAITNATIIDSGYNYITFEVASTSTVKITAESYSESSQQFEAVDSSYLGSNPKIKEMVDVRMVSPLNAQEVVDNQLRLYLFKYKIDADVLNHESMLSDKVNIDVLSGFVTKIETDLVAKDISTMEVIGNAKPNNG